MSVNLNQANQQFLDEAVRNGQYADRDIAINEAIDLLRKRDQLIQDVNAGIRQLDDGEGIVLADDEELRAFFEEIKAEGRRRLAERANGQ